MRQFESERRFLTFPIADDELDYLNEILEYGGGSTDEVLLYLREEVDKFLEDWEKLGFPDPRDLDLFRLFRPKRLIKSLMTLCD
jgi:hypothetical protein